MSIGDCDMSCYQKDLVSVIVPVYKTEPFLRDCIDSILAQTHSNLEIILVDDGSPDGSPAICDEYAAADRRIHVIHKENSGVSDTRNTGIDAATGEWIAFVDSDDAISPQMIETLLNTAENEQVCPAVSFSRFMDQYVPGSFDGEAVRFTESTKSFTSWRSGMFVWGTLYHRSLINRLNLRFDIRIGNLEDVVWNAIYLPYVTTMAYIPARMYHYRQNPNSITSRCSDKKWQVDSWFRARSFVINWFFENDISAERIPHTKAFLRYCNNNIFAECTEGKLSFADYNTLRKKSLWQSSSADAVLGFEYRFERSFPWLYYLAYMTLMKLRNWLRR